MSKHPIQPLVKDEKGVLRFKKNAIVVYILDNGGIDLNQIAAIPFSQEDRDQFTQLIGYSLSGYGELSYISDEAYYIAEGMLEKGLDERDARISYLETILEKVREGIKIIAPEIFKIHPDDLTI